MMSHSVVNERMRLCLFTFSCFARKYEYGTEHVFLRLNTDRFVSISTLYERMGIPNTVRCAVNICKSIKIQLHLLLDECFDANGRIMSCESVFMDTHPSRAQKNLNLST